MQNRFGLKDFVLLVLVGVVGIMVLLSMLQVDRLDVKINESRSKLGEIERQSGQVGQLGGRLANVEAQLGQINQRLQNGVNVVPPGNGMQAPVSTGSNAVVPTGRTGDHDESWARAGAPIEWQPAYVEKNDPRKVPGFKDGGEMTEIFPAQFPTVVPYIVKDAYGNRLLDNVLESLGSYDPETLKFRGVLAEAWQIDPKGLWLRAKIRPEATFSDGEPVRAEDFVYTFKDFLMNKQLETERYRSTYDKVEDVVEIRPDVVEFHFSEALFSNASNALGLGVVPKHYYSKFSPGEINRGTSLLMGSGPYRFENPDINSQWTPPKPFVLVRNERYWGPRPALDKLRYVVISDETASLVTYRNGDAEFMTPTAPQFVKISKEPDWDKENQSLNWTNMRTSNSFIAWQCGVRSSTGKLTPFADKRVRRAMAYLIDRQKIVDSIFAGIGKVSRGVAGPESPAAAPDQKPLPYDLNKAHELLAEAGWTDRDGSGVLKNDKGEEFSFEYTYINGGEITLRIATFVKDACTAAGIRCQIKPIDFAILTTVLTSRDFDAVSFAWQQNSPESDPKQIWHSESIKNNGDNFAQWSNPEADRLIDLGRKEMNEEKRMQIWHQFESVVEADQPYTWLRVAPTLAFVKKTIGNVHTYRAGLDRTEFCRVAPVAPTKGN